MVVEDCPARGDLSEPPDGAPHVVEDEQQTGDRPDHAFEDGGDPRPGADQGQDVGGVKALPGPDVGVATGDVKVATGLEEGGFDSWEVHPARGAAT